MLCSGDCLIQLILSQPTEITQFIYGQPLKRPKSYNRTASYALKIADTSGECRAQGPHLAKHQCTGSFRLRCAPQGNCHEENTVLNLPETATSSETGEKKGRQRLARAARRSR